MVNKEYTQMSESYILGALLTIVGGFLDAYTYISRGNVFANTQTGNIILLGLNLAEKNWIQVFRYMIPILAFISGVILSEVIKVKFKQNPNVHWRQIVIAVEILVLLIVAFIPQGNMNVMANIAVSFVCSLQYDSFKKFTTTMCTGNLRIAADQLFIYMHEKNSEARTKSLQYYGIILFFVFGVVLGTFFTKFFNVKAVLFSCIILLIVFVIMFIENIEDSIAKIKDISNKSML
ncbi:MAG: YoaK family protein [Clostridiaceae bacterium]